MRLILAEKPSVAADIAKALGSVQRREGYFQVGQDVVTYAIGHLLSIDDSAAPPKWSLDTIPIFPDRFSYTVNKMTSKQFKVVKGLLKTATEVVVATDAGREGELIARLILTQSGYKGPLKRLWTSKALTPQVVQDEFKRLKPGSAFDSLYQSALARQHSDWLVGINLTRLVTIKGNNTGVWSVGRVQSPTLKLIVDRDIERENFKPQPYAVVKAIFSKGPEQYEGLLVTKQVPPAHKEEGAQLEAKDDDTKFRLSRADGARIVQELMKEQNGTVTSVSKEKRRELPPLLHSLTSLQREANTVYGLSAADTLKTAQDLYEKHKATSYPRTDAQHMSASNHQLAIDVLTRLGKGALASKVQSVGKRVFDDTKLTDHHAVIPLAPLPAGATDRERKVYNLIYRKFVGAFTDPHDYETITVITTCGTYDFQSKGKREINLGWRELYTTDKQNAEDQALPALAKGDRVTKVKVVCQDRETKPPPAYTEASLLKKMEVLGLGTPATRAAIIETLAAKNRYYIQKQGRALLSTSKGRELINKLTGSDVASPEMTAEWEKGLDDIYKQNKGPGGYAAFLDGIKKFLDAETLRLKAVTITANFKIEQPHGGRRGYGKAGGGHKKGGSKSKSFYPKRAAGSDGGSSGSDAGRTKSRRPSPSKIKADKKDRYEG
jgi:DNA topoisomerase-3